MSDGESEHEREGERGDEKPPVPTIADGGTTAEGSPQSPEATEPSESNASSEPTEAESTEAAGGGPSRGPYVESTIIMTTVRVVAPFIFTLGLFVMFHGASSPGGGFQGGAIASAMLLMFAIAFGIEPTREWLDSTVLTAAITGGVLVFALIGLGSLALGASFLEYSVYPIPHASKYGIELVELAIGAIVAGVLTGLFFVIAAGFDLESEGGESG